MERIQKIIAHSGLYSRRKAEELITKGLVKLNGKIVTDLAIKVDPKVDQITIQEKPLPIVPTLTYILNKPKGVVCSTSRQKNEQIITDLLPKFPHVYPVGRLDKESEGLLLISNDGDLTFQLTHPSFEHPKTYYLRVRLEKDSKPLIPEQISHQLLKGVKLGDGRAKADAVKVKIDGEQFILEIEIHEGRHHLVRRMCAALNLEVILLRRVKFATLSLGNLKPGQFRLLTTQEKTTLQCLPATPPSLP